MRTEQAAQLLAGTQLFGGIEEKVLQRLAERAVERSYRRGQLICYEGDPGDTLLVLVEGLVKVFVTSPAGETMVLVTLRPPDTFGELSLVDGGNRSASAEAVEQTVLLSLGRSAFLDLVKENPSLAEGLLRALSGLVRRLTEQAADLVFLDLPGRVAKLLLAMAEEKGGEETENIDLDLHVTQTDLADMVGGSRQSVNQILHSFERRGYLEVEGRRVVIKRLDLLRRALG
jgi:CRP/FNR family transcriptional regulator, cyclic AMP receptor protein